MKRQQYACDQCRRSKRGCDAPQLELPKNMDPLRDGKMIVGEKRMSCLWTPIRWLTNCSTTSSIFALLLLYQD